MNIDKIIQRNLKEAKERTIFVLENGTESAVKQFLDGEAAFAVCAADFGTTLLLCHGAGTNTVAIGSDTVTPIALISRIITKAADNWEKEFGSRSALTPTVADYKLVCCGSETMQVPNRIYLNGDLYATLEGNKLTISTIPSNNSIKLADTANNNTGDYPRKVNEMKIKSIIPEANPWTADEQEARNNYFSDPTEDNRKILVAIIGEEEVEKIDGRREAIENVSSLVGYDANLRTTDYNSMDYKVSFCLTHGGREAREAAEAYMEEQQTARDAAAAETIREINSAAFTAGLVKEYIFSSKNESSLSYAGKLAEAAYLRARMSGDRETATAALKLAMEEAKKGNTFIDDEILAVMNNKSPEDFRSCLISFWTCEIFHNNGRSQRVSLTKTALNRPEEFIMWLNGFRSGYTDIINTPYGDQTVMRPQTDAEAHDLSAIRAFALANILAGKVVETATTKEGKKYLRRGVRGVEIANALIGYFGDPTGEYATEGAARAGALTDLLDKTLKCGRTLRDFLGDVKEARNERAAERKLMEEAYAECSGVTSAKFALDRAYQAAFDATYGVEDISEDVSDERFTRWVNEYTETIGNLIWDFVAIIRDEDRFKNLERKLAEEYGKNIDLMTLDAAMAPARYDMRAAKRDLKTLIQLPNRGDELGLAETIAKSFELAADMVASGNNADWLKMYANAAKGYSCWDILAALTENNHELFNTVSAVLYRNIDTIEPTKGMVKALVNHQVPGLWKEAVAGDPAVWDGMTADFSEIADISDAISVSGNGAWDWPVLFGCDYYRSERETIADRVKTNDNLIKWYGRLIIEVDPQMAPEINLETIRAWMDGFVEGQKPWESYPKANLVPGNKLFNEAAIAQFGTAKSVVTDDDLKEFSAWLKETGKESGGSDYAREILNRVWNSDTQKAVEEARELNSKLNG